MDALDLIRELGLPVTRDPGRGRRSPHEMWRQLQADVFGVPIHHSQVDEGPAFGAALLAGVACGAYASVADACRRVRFDPDVTQPDPGRHDLYRRYHAVYSSVYSAMAPTMHRLAELS
jgi:xylulokinase